MQSITTDVDGLSVVSTREDAEHTTAGYPLLVLLHGGGYTSEYFNVAGSQAGSLVDIANRNGFDVLRIDRPGYGESAHLPDEENTYARQAEVLSKVVESVLSDDDRAVVVVGHSIGGMIALELAALQPRWRLVGVAISGMGAQLSSSGLGRQMGAIPGPGLADLPIEVRNQIFFGPEATLSEGVVESARVSYGPAPIVELRAAALWADERLDGVGRSVSVPVYHVLGQHDSMWDVSDAALASFSSRFGQDVVVTSEVLSQAGHSIDHHIVGATLHYRQLGFAHRWTTV